MKQVAKDNEAKVLMQIHDAVLNISQILLMPNVPNNHDGKPVEGENSKHPGFSLMDILRSFNIDEALAHTALDAFLEFVPGGSLIQFYTSPYTHHMARAALNILLPSVLHSIDKRVQQIKDIRVNLIH